MSQAATADRSASRLTDDGLVTGEAVALDVRPASAVMRGGGTAIDVIATVLVLIGVLLLASSLSLDEAAMRAISITALVVCLVVVPTAVETATHGRSIGKLALGLRVVRDDGGAIGFRHAFIRALTGVVEIYLTLGGLAVVVGFLNPSSKRLGDLLAGTHAQVERVPKVVPQSFGVPTQLLGWAATTDVGRLPDPLERRIAAFFRNAPHLEPNRRAAIAATLAAEAAPFVSSVPDAPAELFLAAIAALRRDRDLTALTLEDRRMADLAPVLTARPNGFPER
ncbi:RDD family protein [Agromyces intestinalis]|uniref:RDD family protein n=1 Tax=Agromyces intestinalis TaxID=2592652 RepID=A0A5C1YBZ4_9MICO|nr:RDD family protein [Agromyces intestinalis]QEO13506.1 RDD family protein [Agromyces intestinalis]